MKNLRQFGVDAKYVGRVAGKSSGVAPIEILRPGYKALARTE